MQVPHMLCEFRNDGLIVGPKIRETVCHSAHHYLPDSSAHTIYAVRKEDEDPPADRAKLRTSAPFRLDTCTDTSCGRVRYIRTRSIDIDIDWSIRVLAVGFP